MLALPEQCCLTKGCRVKNCTAPHPLAFVCVMARLGHAKLSCKTKGKAIKSLRFADDTNGLAGEEEELAKLAERLDKASTA